MGISVSQFVHMTYVLGLQENVTRSEGRQTHMKWSCNRYDKTDVTNDNKKIMMLTKTLNIT